MSLHLSEDPLAGSLKTVVKLLTHRLPRSPLHNIALVFDSVFYVQNHQGNIAQMAKISGKKYRALYRKIDDILCGQQRDEGTLTSLTLKSSYGLPKQIVDQMDSLFTANFPKLHRAGRLKIVFSVWGKQFPTQLYAHP